jgi:hypothetical protein
MGDVALPQKNKMKYLGMHLDRRLTWAKHIKAKINQLNPKVKKCTGYSEEVQHYQLKVYYNGIQLWGTASNSSIEIFQPFQSKNLRTIPNAPWYINKCRIHEDP